MPELLDRQLLSGKRTYTCEMEGISSRLRKFLQKNLSEDNLMAAFEILFKKQIRQLKIFLILTGYEDQSDIDDFKSFLSSLKALQTSLSNRTKLTFSFATLFRPPLTPFQFSDKRSSIPEMKNALNALAEEILKNGFESRVSAPVYDAIVSEFIAYSDRRATPVLVNSSIAQRFIYRGDVKEKVSDYWIKSMKELGFRHPESFPMDERANLKFPWDDIDAGVKKEFLLSNYLKLKSGEEIFSCISEPWGLGSCSGCGACSSAEEINEKNQFGPTAGHHVLPHSPIKTKKYIVAGQIPEQWGYCDREFIKAAVSRRLMMAYPDLIKPFKKITNIAPTLFSWGKFAAEFEVDETWSPNSRSTVIDEKVWNEVVINKVYPGKNGIADCLFPASVEIDLSKIEESETDISRNIDQLLTKYKIKHMKKRNNGVMNWDVNSGQAKKSGIGQISLNEIERRLTLVLIKWPEIFLINKISYGLPLKVV
jgi:hypothetical protein